MKPTTTLLLSVIIGAIAFVAARQSANPRSLTEAETPRRAEVRSSSRPRNETARSAREITEKDPAEKVGACSGPSLEEARRMTSRERMELLASGSQIYNGSNQTEFLIGMIGSLTKEELTEATNILGGSQDRGNGMSQQIWDTLWKQWGRVDPRSWISRFGSDSSGKSQADARNMMAGWLETDPAAALAWAQGPKPSNVEAAAAARAITSASDGNLKQMRADIIEFSDESVLTRRQCLQDYFDTAMLSGDNPSVASIYGDLPASLRESAWPVALHRMTLEDPKTAVTWFEENLSASAWKEPTSFLLADRLANDDPAGTTRWLSSLPGAEAAANQGHHPVFNAAGKWLEKDPAAARQWLDSLPADSPWALKLKPQVLGEGQ